jgi:hypothetical protein
MRVKAEYRDAAFPPLLILNIHGAPHRRVHTAVILDYRREIRRACIAAGLIHLPIDHPIDLSVLFVDPCSPDLGNLYLALEQALDGATLGPNAVLADDSLVQAVTMSKIVHPKRAASDETKPVPLPRFLPIEPVAA